MSFFSYLLIITIINKIIKTIPPEATVIDIAVVPFVQTIIIIDLLNVNESPPVPSSVFVVAVIIILC